MQLQKFNKFTGCVTCKTGLHIGGSVEQMEIGGVDNPIIKHPITREPYIPGSSLKGKMRSALEFKHAKIQGNGKPCGCARQDCKVCLIFGPHKRSKHDLGPTRILVRDAFLSDHTRKEYNALVEEKGVSYIEQKTENIINRKTGAAEHPRTQERVPAGAKFDFEITLQILSGDKETEMVEFVKDGLRLVQETYLGGYGSRGSGKVVFEDLKLNGEPFTL